MILTVDWSTPVAASQYRSHISWVPPGKVIAKVTSFRAFSAFTALATLSTSRNPTELQKSLERVMACPLLLRTIAMGISLPAVPPTPV